MSQVIETLAAELATAITALALAEEKGEPVLALFDEVVKLREQLAQVEETIKGEKVVV